MFLGTHTPKLDEKGRLFLPAKFRDELADGLVITRGQEHCLTVWPKAEFDQEGRRDRQGAGDEQGGTRLPTHAVRRCER